MRIRKLIGPLAALFCATTAVFGDVLTFVGQLDFNGVIDANWSSSGNWFTTDTQGDMVSAGRLPLETDTAVITGTADVGNQAFRILSLVLNTNATVQNGDFGLQTLRMQAGSSFNNFSLFLSSAMTVEGPGCGLTNVALTVLWTATVTVGPVAPEATADLTLAEGTMVLNGGQIVLLDGAELDGGDGQASELELEPGTSLTSSGAALVRGPAAGQLVLDNNGTICADSGTLAFEGGIDWQCTGGLEQFTAATNDALIVFDNAFIVDAGVTCLFTGPGTNQLTAGASFDGTVLVGTTDTTDQLFPPGNLQIEASVDGGGSLEAVGGSGQGAVVAWSGGTLDLATVTIDADASLLIDGGQGLSGGALNNSGLCILLSPQFAIGPGAKVTNLPGGTFAVQTNAVFSGVPGLSAFANAGAFQLTAGGVTQFGTNSPPAGPDFYNQGQVDVQAGQLNLLGGASSGEFQTAAGAILWFWGGTHTLNPGASFTGNGSVRLLQGASAAGWIVNGNLTVPELEVGSNGTLDSPAGGTGTIQVQSLLTSDNATFNLGSFALQNARFGDSTRFNGSSIRVSDSLTVGGSNCWLAGAGLALQTGSALTLSPDVPGTAANLTAGAGSQITLSDGAQLSGEGAPPGRLALSPGATLTSSGTVVLQGSPAGHLVIDNSGTICARSGALQLDETIDWQCSGGSASFIAAAPAALILFGGPYRVETNAVTLFTGLGTNRFLAGGTIAGAVEVGMVNPLTQSFSAGNLDIADSLAGGGTLHALGNSSKGSLVSWDHGTLRLASVTIDAGASLLLNGGPQFSGAYTLNGTLINSGTVGPGAYPGTLAIVGANDYQQAATGTLVVELGGKSAGTQFSQVAVAGSASLAGRLQLRLLNGFIPQPGDTFQLLTCAACAGAFNGLSGPQPADTLWMPHYTGTNVTLRLASQVLLAQPSLAPGKLRLPFNTTAGFAYVVQKTDTLCPADWQTLTTIQGSGAIEAFEDSAAQSQAFYRVLMQ
ncbi:MAG: beta strand repeat-containing protein [Limisphaerales bacterium]